MLPRIILHLDFGLIIFWGFRFEDDETDVFPVHKKNRLETASLHKKKPMSLLVQTPEYLQ